MAPHTINKSAPLACAIRTMCCVREDAISLSSSWWWQAAQFCVPVAISVAALIYARRANRRLLPIVKAELAVCIQTPIGGMTGQQVLAHFGLKGIPSEVELSGQGWARLFASFPSAVPFSTSLIVRLVNSGLADVEVRNVSIFTDTGHNAGQRRGKQQTRRERTVEAQSTFEWSLPFHVLTDGAGQGWQRICAVAELGNGERVRSGWTEVPAAAIRYVGSRGA